MIISRRSSGLKDSCARIGGQSGSPSAVQERLHFLMSRHWANDQWDDNDGWESGPWHSAWNAAYAQGWQAGYNEGYAASKADYNDGYAAVNARSDVELPQASKKKKKGKGWFGQYFAQDPADTDVYPRFEFWDDKSWQAYPEILPWLHELCGH